MTLAYYLSKLFLLRLALFWGGGALFMLAVELPQNTDLIFAHRQNGFAALVEYSVLRLPELSTDIVKFAYLMAALFTFAHLVRHRELTAIWDAGVSQFSLILRLLPVALVLGSLQFWISDQVVPVTGPKLMNWNVGEGPAEDIKILNMAQNALWFRSGTDIVRVPKNPGNFDVLRNITIFQRDREGRMTTWLDVGEARFQDGHWRLKDVNRLRMTDNAFTRVPDQDWQGGPTPAALSRLGVHPRYLSFAELGRLVSGEQQRFWPAHLYATWQHGRLAGIVMPLVLITLIAALSEWSQQPGRVDRLYFSGLLIGFFYFMFNGVSLTMGEVGVVPPFIAGWGPPLCLTAIAGAIAFWQEDVGPQRRRRRLAEGEPHPA